MIDKKFFCFDLEKNGTIYLIKGEYIKSIHAITDCLFNTIPKNGEYVEKLITLNGEAIPVVDICKWLNIENPRNPTSVILINYKDKKYSFEINEIYGLFDMDINNIFENNGMAKVDFITYLEDKMVCSLDVKHFVENLYK